MADGASYRPDGSHNDDVSVIAGKTWIVVVTSDRGADRVHNRLGGEIQPAHGTQGPDQLLRSTVSLSPTA